VKLQDKVALITGSTRGIGEETARRMAAQGAAVVVTGRNKSRGERVAESIEESGGRALFVQTDVGVEEDVRNAVAAAVSAFGGLDILVNNAAPTDLMATQTTRLTEVSHQEFDDVMRVGLYGTVWACKYAIPEMVNRGGGSIVNISSIAAIRGLPGVCAYSCSKGAMNALTRQLALDYSPERIRVNTIVVGAIMNEMSSGVLATPEAVAAMESIHLTGRLGDNRDIAFLSVFLASDESGFITGNEFIADGGSASVGPLPRWVVEDGLAGAPVAAAKA